MKKEDLKEMMRQTVQNGKSIVAVEMDEVEEFMNCSEVVNGCKLKGNSQSWIAMMGDEILRLKALNEDVVFSNVLFVVKSKDCAIRMDELDRVCEKLGETMPTDRVIWGLMVDETMQEHEVEVSLLMGN